MATVNGAGAAFRPVAGLGIVALGLRLLLLLRRCERGSWPDDLGSVLLSLVSEQQPRLRHPEHLKLGSRVSSSLRYFGAHC